VITNLVQYIHERFSLKASIAISFILFTAPFSMTNFQFAGLLAGVFSTFSFLLILRIVDDISDRRVDEISHPERGLVSGRIDVRKLKYMIGLIAGFVLIMNTELYLILFVLATSCYYALYFRYKRRISIIFQIPFINLIFFLIPVYAGIRGSARTEWPLILMGLFTWFSAMAHDIAHGIHTQGESHANGRDFSMTLGPNHSAIVAAGVYLLAMCTGMAFCLCSRNSLIFILLLAGTSVQIMYLCKNLIQNPDQPRATPFYIYGFTFFLIPLTGLMLENLIFKIMLNYGDSIK